MSAVSPAGAPHVTAAPAITVRNLVKSSGEVRAVQGVSFDVAPGEVFGFLGPNGAGKTTTINVLCTLARPTAGQALVAGHDVASDRVRIHTDAIATLRGRYGIEASVSEGAVSFGVPSGEEFVPRLFAEADLSIRSVSVSRPTLDDVFMSFTGSSIAMRRKMAPSTATA